MKVTSETIGSVMSSVSKTMIDLELLVIMSKIDLDPRMSEKEVNAEPMEDLVEIALDEEHKD